MPWWGPEPGPNEDRGNLMGEDGIDPVGAEVVVAEEGGRCFDSETPEMSDSRMVDRSGLMKRGERGGCMLELKLECKEGEWDMSMCMSNMGMTTKATVRMR
jgi:hypothetical protein